MCAGQAHEEAWYEFASNVYYQKFTRPLLKWSLEETRLCTPQTPQWTTTTEENRMQHNQMQMCALGLRVCPLLSSIVTVPNATPYSWINNCGCLFPTVLHINVSDSIKRPQAVSNLLSSLSKQTGQKSKTLGRLSHLNNCGWFMSLTTAFSLRRVQGRVSWNILPACLLYLAWVAISSSHGGSLPFFIKFLKSSGGHSSSYCSISQRMDCTNTRDFLM